MSAFSMRDPLDDAEELTSDIPAPEPEESSNAPEPQSPEQRRRAELHRKWEQVVLPFVRRRIAVCLREGEDEPIVRLLTLRGGAMRVAVRNGRYCIMVVAMRDDQCRARRRAITARIEIVEQLERERWACTVGAPEVYLCSHELLGYYFEAAIPVFVDLDSVTLPPELDK